MTGNGARLAVLGVFFAGFVAGAAALQLVRHRLESRIFHAPDPVAQLVVYKLDQELKLSSEQKEEVRQAIHGARDEILALAPDLLPRVAAAFERSQERIARALTPAQRERFERIVAERRRLLRRVTPAEAPR